MQEGLAANKALFGTVAVKKPVYAGEIVIAPAIADRAFLTERPGVAAGKVDALRRVRVARQELEALVGIRVHRGIAGIARRGIQEEGGRRGVVAGFAPKA